MAYVSLYRKYRPQSFDDVVGQDHVTQTLRNAIDDDRLHHAYLFTGPRGTGKTSTARILAKAVNCEQGPTSAPCGECEQCTSIAAGSSVDVIELDMASHGGVDDARDLRDRARFAPVAGRRKVYILDEVHMASTAAFNALLKLVEEPPDHVIFAMATTDPQKVIPTIMSRVQRFDLRRVAAAEVAAHVREICADEGYDIEDGAVDAVVRAGDGSIRDALSVLEQVLAYAGEVVTADAVAQVLGQTPFEQTAAAVDRMAGSDLGGVMALVQELQDAGLDLRRFAFDLLQHLRDLVVLQAAPDHPDLVDATDERRAELAEQAARVPRETLLHAVDVLGEAVTEMRLGPPRLPLELALATLATPATSGDLRALADRVARLEQGGAERPAGSESTGRTSAAATGGGDPGEDGDAAQVREAPDEAAAGSAQSGSADHGTTDAAEPAAAPDAPDDALAAVRQGWDAILEIVKDESRRIHAVYDPAEPLRVRNNILTLRYPKRYASFHADNAGKGQFSQVLTDAIERTTGQRLRIEAVIEGDDVQRPQPPLVGGGASDAAPGSGDGDGSGGDDDRAGPAAERDAPPPSRTDDDGGLDPDEGAEVREAELRGSRRDPDEAVARATELVVGELGGEPVDEPPA